MTATTEGGAVQGATDTCQCGHHRGAHSYWNGICRAFPTCESGCTEFRLVCPDGASDFMERVDALIRKVVQYLSDVLCSAVFGRKEADASGDKKFLHS